MRQWEGYGPDGVRRADGGVTEIGASRAPVTGTLTYEPYYGLKTKPFSLSTDPRTLYKSPSHAAVLEDLLGAVRRREGLIVLTGEMGTGKTTLCRAALYELDRKTLTTFVPDPCLSREDLLRMLLVGFGEVSVGDLKQGRLKETPRADLGCQLYEFLTSLESVDAFAVLVIDEAQRLAPPLLDEIRVLSEMEAGRRLLQIVLVGQPELRSRLKLPEMRHIDQRVTAACELRPLTREGVGGYVSHRLAVAGGARDRVEFSTQALDLVHDASGGIPRLVNRICDRALVHGHLERIARIGPLQIRNALRDLDVSPPGPGRTTDARARIDLPPEPEVTRVVPPRDAAGPKGLFEKNRAAESSSPLAADLKALLDLPAMPVQPGGSPLPTMPRLPWTSHRPPRRSRWSRSLRALSMPALGMTVMILASGLAISRIGGGTGSVELPPPPAPPRPVPVIAARTDRSDPAESPAPGPTPEAGAAQPAAGQTWVVQVAAFASQARSSTAVQRLTEAGLPAYQVPADLGARGRLNLVRVGPFQSPGEADAVRARVRSVADFEGAFVRNITALD